MINGENLSNKMTKACPMAKYDAYAKEILAEKSVLSFIMANVIPEYQGMDPKNIIPLIEGKPQIDVPVNPDEALMPAITGDNTEDNTAGEGKIHYDINCAEYEVFGARRNHYRVSCRH